MNNVMIVIDGSEPLDFDWVSAGIFLEFVPHGESALSGGVALNIDVRGSDSSFVGLSWLVFSDHLGMLFVHRSDQILGHMVYIIERLPSSLLYEIQNFATFEKLRIFAANFDSWVLLSEMSKFCWIEQI
jgi:hypothetical protein